jgi:Na+/phosphate symporter
MLGKAAFYFGFIFFGLDLVSGALKPMAQTTVFEDLIRRAGVPLMGVLLGIVLTALVQSSTIVTGLCIVMVQQNLLTATAAIPIVIGTNIGTTLKGLLITLGMKGTARRVALANICFNVESSATALRAWTARPRRHEAPSPKCVSLLPAHRAPAVERLASPLGREGTRADGVVTQ